MGVLSGFFTGLTLTSATLYFSLTLHQRARQHQSALLRQQVFLLNSLVDPSLLPPDDEPRPRYMPVRAGWSERWKDGWNAEVEGAVRWVQEVRWDGVRDGVEERWREWRGRERRV